MFSQKAKKGKKYKWDPVVCNDINVLFKTMELTKNEDEGITRWIISYMDKRHKLGIVADYARGKFFDYEYYLDDQRFKDLDELKSKAIIDGEWLSAIRNPILILCDEDLGNPLNYIPLEKFLDESNHNIQP